jgi:hypothetical protein
MASHGILLILGLLALFSVPSSVHSQSLVMTPDPEDGPVTANERGVKLRCFYNVTESETGELLKVDWFYHPKEEGLDKQQMDDDVVEIEKETGTSILKLIPGDYEQGKYTCEAGSEVGEFTVKFYFKLIKWERSIVIWDGADHHLECVLKEASDLDGNPTFSWYTKAEGVEDPNLDDERKELLTNSTTSDMEPHFKIFNHHNRSVLKFEDANNDDRGFYQCEVTNDDGLVASVQTMVRVKNQYGAIYPFIGIVIEVVVLLFIILVCEKRRASKEAANENCDDEDEDDFNGAAGSAAGNSNVRHRRN